MSSSRQTRKSKSSTRKVVEANPPAAETKEKKRRGRKRKGQTAAVDAAASVPPAGNATAHKLLVALDYAPHPVQRQVLVRSDTTLLDLAAVVMAAFDWSGMHMHGFVQRAAGSGGFRGERNSFRAAAQMSRMDEEDGVRKEDDVAVEDVLKAAGDTLGFTYDFGADHSHTITVLQIMPAEEGKTYPLCIAATGAALPEDGESDSEDDFSTARINSAIENRSELLEYF